MGSSNPDYHLMIILVSLINLMSITRVQPSVPPKNPTASEHNPQTL